MPSVLVTGAGRGLGLAITRHLSTHGWEVYATARSEDALRELAGIPHVHPTRLDITDRASVSALAAQLPDVLDGVVNNAGIVVNGPVEGLTLDRLEHQLDVNVVAQIAVTQAVLPKIRAAGGRIVFISSISGWLTIPGNGAYCASKYALESLADALRMELRPWKIPVSLVEPGAIRTDIWTGILDDHDRMESELTAEHRALYRSHLTGMRALLSRMQKTAAAPDKVVKAVDHALTARRPKRRYLLDPASRVQKIVVRLAPTAVTDAVLSAVTTSRR